MKAGFPHNERLWKIPRSDIQKFWAIPGGHAGSADQGPNETKLIRFNIMFSLKIMVTFFFVNP